MTDWNYWLVFFTAAIALNVSPGPDLLYILSRTIAQGTKVGLASAAGVCSGAVVHVLTAAFGLSALLATSATTFAVVKYAGAAYLLYLGVQALKSRGNALEIPVHEESVVVTPWQAFRQGALVDILNPKTAIFFMAFLPQFVRPNLGSSSSQLIFLGLLVIFVGLIIESIFVLIAARSTDFFRRNPKTSAWLDHALGAILVSLGFKLALTGGRE